MDSQVRDMARSAKIGRLHRAYLETGDRRKLKRMRRIQAQVREANRKRMAANMRSLTGEIVKVGEIFQQAAKALGALGPRWSNRIDPRVVPPAIVAPPRNPR